MGRAGFAGVKQVIGKHLS